MTLLYTHASAQAPSDSPDAASTELLLYLAEFEADVDPVELSEWESKHGTLDRQQDTPARDDKHDNELAHEPN